VEIAGVGGQVFAVRPSGVRRSGSLQTVATDSDDKCVTVRVDSPANNGEAPHAMFNATQRELHDLLVELGGLPSEPENDEVDQVEQKPKQTVSDLVNTVEDAHAEGASTDNIIEMTPTAATPPLSSSALLVEAAEALGESSPFVKRQSSPTNEEIARRIQGLSACRRRALLAQLEAAEEADAAETAVGVVATTDMLSQGVAEPAATEVAAAVTA